MSRFRPPKPLDYSAPAKGPGAFSAIAWVMVAFLGLGVAGFAVLTLIILFADSSFWLASGLIVGAAVLVAGAMALSVRFRLQAVLAVFICIVAIGLLSLGVCAAELHHANL